MVRTVSFHHNISLKGKGQFNDNLLTVTNELIMYLQLHKLLYSKTGKFPLSCRDSREHRLCQIA